MPVRIPRPGERRRRLPYTLVRIPPRRDVEVGYIRDPGAITVQDPTTGLWQGRMITPDIMSPETLRYAAARSQVYSTILGNFMREAARFARRPMFDGDVGFEVVPKIRQHQMTEAEAREAKRIEDFLLRTGRYYNPRRTDMFREFLVKQVYNTCVFDRMATEVVWGKGSPLEFYALDGSTIIKVNPDVYVPQTQRGQAVAPVSYIQLHKDQLWAEFNASELLFGVRNPYPALINNGYGVPELMELMEPITLEILILTYIDRLLTQGSIPEGLLILKSARKGQEIESLSMTSGQMQQDIQRMIRNQVGGAQNAGRLAVLRLRGGEDATLVLNDRDLNKMPFIQTYEVIQNQICRRMGVDPIEVGIVQGAIRSSFIDSDTRNSRSRTARSRAVTNLLYAISDTQLNPLVEMMNPDFCVIWRGIDTQLEMERLNIEAQREKMGLITLNQILTHQNLPTYPEDEEHFWASIPLHPQIVQIEAAKRGLRISGTGRGAGGGGALTSPTDNQGLGPFGGRN